MKRLESLEVSLSESVYWRGRAEARELSLRSSSSKKRATVLSDVSVTADFVEAEVRPRQKDYLAPVEEL